MASRTLRSASKNETSSLQQSRSIPLQSPDDDMTSPPPPKKRKTTSTTTSQNVKPKKTNRYAINKKASFPNKYSNRPNPAAKKQQRPRPSTNASPKMRIPESQGDFFSAPPNTLLIHATNCQGTWGGGIAAAFATKYPAAYKTHKDFCKAQGEEALLGKGQLIPPPTFTGNEKKRHFVGCVFTSKGYGTSVGTPKEILAATRPAMEDLLRLVKEWNDKAEEGQKVGEVRMCMINSGLFKVPWDGTRRELEDVDGSAHGVEEIRVVYQ